MDRSTVTPPLRTSGTAHRLVAGLTAVLVLASCGDDGGTTLESGSETTSAPITTAPPTTPAPTSPAPTSPAPTSPAPTSPAPTSPAPTSPAPTSTAPAVTEPSPDPEADLALAEAALLTEVTGTNWAPNGFPPFPVLAEVARTVPSCAAFAELMFEGGAEHGQAASTAIGDGVGTAFTHAIVFPDEAAAIAVLEAAATPEFDVCWTDYASAAALAGPFGITEAAYESDEPPVLAIEADQFVMHANVGSFVLGGTTFDDSCVCAFARVGRGVVMVHAAADAMDVEFRTQLVQGAVDRMREVLAGG